MLGPLAEEQKEQKLLFQNTPTMEEGRSWAKQATGHGAMMSASAKRKDGT